MEKTALSGLPPILLTELRRGRVLPFAGAGVSRSVLYTAAPPDDVRPRFPGWSELLAAASQRLTLLGRAEFARVIDSLLTLTPPRLLPAAEYAREGLAEDWPSFLRSQLAPPRTEVVDSSLDLARQLWKIASVVITTNYDDVLTWATDDPTSVQRWSIQFPPGQALLLRDQLDSRVVWHLHGHIDKPSDLILTPDGYSRLYPPTPHAETHYTAALHTLRSLILSHTLLFVGFSFDDQIFGNQLRWATDVFEGAPGPHFILARAADVEHVRLRTAGTGLEIVSYADHGAPLLGLLGDLLEAVDAARPTLRPIDIGILHNLPKRPAIPFVGRDTEVATVSAHLLAGRLVSVEGAGGTGKTAVALEVAHRFATVATVATLGAPFRAVVWLSAKTTILTTTGASPREASVTDLESVFVVIAHTLRKFDILHETGIRRYQSVLTELRETPALLVIDNFETVRDANRILQFLKELPEHSAAVITCRDRLDVHAVCHLGELGIEELTSIVESEMKQRDLDIAANDSGAVARMAGGSPLAALWLVGRLAVGGGSVEIESAEAAGLLAFLFGEQLDALSIAARDVLVALALFPAGAEVSDLVGCVNGATSAHIRELNTHSLAERDANFIRLLPITKELLLRTTNESASSVLDALQPRVAKAIYDFTAREAIAILQIGSHRSNWRRHRENVLWAINYYVTQQREPDAALLVAKSYWPMLMNGELALYASFANDVLSSTAVPPEVRADVLLCLASMSFHRDDFDDAENKLDAARCILTSVEEVNGDTQNMLNFVEAVLAVECGAPAASPLLEAAVAFERSRGIVWTTVGFLGWTGILRCRESRWLDAERVSREALDLAKEHRLFRSHTFVSIPLARSLRQQNRLHEAGAICDDALAMADESAEMHNFAHLCLERAHIALAAGDHTLSTRFAKQSQTLYGSLGLSNRASTAQRVVEATLAGGHS